MSKTLAWGAKVSPQFREAVFALCARCKLNPDFLMACMAWETGERFSATVRNGAGSGAVGLIQFMPATLRGMGLTVERALAMSAEDQLILVERYFQPYTGRLVTMSDHYMAILWPKAIGKAESSTLWSKATMPTTYRQNAGLDIDKNGVITKAEAAAKVQRKLERGMQPGLIWRS